MGNIFISYRRQDAPRQAKALHRIIAERFSEASVFFDVLEHLEPGEDFTRVLEDRIATADAALFVIGPEWNPRTGRGMRRLDAGDDYVRLELATAMQSALPVIPVLVADAVMPRPRDLPSGLRRFSRNEAFAMPPRGFNAAAARLVRKLDDLRSVTLDANGSASNSNNGILRLSILDAGGRPLESAAHFVLRSEDTGEREELTADTVSRRVVIRRLSDRPDNRYLLDVRIPQHRVVRWVVSATPWKSDAVTRIHVPVDPDRVRKAVFPPYDSLPPAVRHLFEATVTARRSAGQMYRAMEALHRAHLLNCYARASSLVLGEGLTLAHVLESCSARLVDLRPDRLFLRIDNAAAVRIAASFENESFVRVPAALHTPPPGYQLAGSGKTPDQLLSFQITLFKGNADHVLEMEFDSVQGLLCVFRVVRENYSGREHPFDVHQLLVRHQRVDPGYVLEVQR